MTISHSEIVHLLYWLVAICAVLAVFKVSEHIKFGDWR